MNIKELILLFLIMFFSIGAAESSTVTEGVQQSKQVEWIDNMQLASGLLFNEANKEYTQLSTLLPSKENDTAHKARNIPIPAAALLFGPAVLCLMGLGGRRE